MTPRIPNDFHFVFGLKKQTEPFHLVHYLCIESCIQVNAPDRVFFYCHFEPYGRYWDLIKDKVTVVSVDLVPAVSEFNYTDEWIQKHFTYAHHSDFIRVKKLIDHGGVYADIDTLFVNKLPQHLFEHEAVMGREDPVLDTISGEYKPSVCNAFIMSRKDGAFLKHLYERMPEALDGTWTGHSCFLINAVSEAHPDLIHLEPVNSFYKHMWTKEGMHTLLEGLDQDFDGVYSMHLWSHLWWSRKRKDFTRFHAGRLTERFVRGVDTTYNVIARKYLPEPRRRRWFFSR